MQHRVMRYCVPGAVWEAAVSLVKTEHMLQVVWIAVGIWQRRLRGIRSQG